MSQRSSIYSERQVNLQKEAVAKQEALEKEKRLPKLQDSIDKETDDMIVKNLQAFRPGDALGRHLTGVDLHSRMRPGLEGRARSEGFGKDVNLPVERKALMKQMRDK